MVLLQMAVKVDVDVVVDVDVTVEVPKAKKMRLRDACAGTSMANSGANTAPKVLGWIATGALIG